MPSSGPRTPTEKFWTSATGAKFVGRIRPICWDRAGSISYIPRIASKRCKAWTEALATKRDYQIEHRVHQPDGEYRWMLSRAAPIMLETGVVREWVGLSSDIQDLKVWPAAGDRTNAVLTGAQLRAARGILNWSVRELSQAAGVSSSTIRRLEEMDGPPPGREDALPPLQAALETGGAEFLFPPSGKPGVRPR